MSTSSPERRKPVATAVHRTPPDDPRGMAASVSTETSIEPRLDGVEIDRTGPVSWTPVTVGAAAYLLLKLSPSFDQSPWMTFGFGRWMLVCADHPLRVALAMAALTLALRGPGRRPN